MTRNNSPLKKGITAVVAMKNEEYTLPFCLQSLIGFANQIVIIDNGSDDTSLQKAHAFKNKFGNQVEVDIIEMPDALLGDCREAGLQATKYQWHLRWDADMVAHTDGVLSIKNLKNKILADSTPRAIQLPRLNLNGDLHHCDPGKVKDQGEPILVWFSKHVIYQEFGKFDTIRVPFFYQQVQEENHYYFHCQGLKSDENLIHRFHYFRWREILNTNSKEKLPSYAHKLDTFKNERNLYLFETNEPCSLKYRYQKQLCPKFEKYDKNKYLPYPLLLEKEINSRNERFIIQYQNNKPTIRIDNQDAQMLKYQPNAEDLLWNPDLFFEKLKNDLPHSIEN